MQHVGCGDRSPWTSDPGRAPRNVWTAATWTASCPKSVADKKLDQRIASNTWKPNLCMWGQKQGLHNSSLRNNLLLINDHTTQKPNPHLNSELFPIVSPVQTRGESQQAYIVLPYAWAAMFTPQYGCQIYHPLPARHTLTPLQQDRTDLAARGWRQRESASGRKKECERKEVQQHPRTQAHPGFLYQTTTSPQEEH